MTVTIPPEEKSTVMHPSPAKPLAIGSAPARSPHRGALISLALATLLAALGTSIVTVGLPILANSFATSFAQTQWIVLAYLLATTIVIVAAGRVGDLIGRRRVLVAGLVVFTLASTLAGFAPGYPALIMARALQGIAAAMMQAMAMAMVGAVVDGSQAGRAMGLLGTMSAVGTALGPSLGGLLIELFGWRALFLVCVPFSLAGALLAHRCLPAERMASPPRTRFDHLGTLLLAGTLAAYTLALTIGARTSIHMFLLLVTAALIGLGLFLLRQRRAAAPLLSLELFRNPVFSAGFITNISVTAAVMATLVIGPFYLVDGLALPAAQVGVVMTVGPLVAAVMGVPAGRLVDRFGTARISAAGLAGMVLGCSALAMASTAVGICGYVVPLAITTAGFAVFQAANNTAVMAEARPDQRGLLSGMLSLSRNLGLVTGAAAMGALFALGSAAQGAIAKPAAAESGMHLSFGITTVLMVVAWGAAELIRRMATAHRRTP